MPIHDWTRVDPGAFHDFHQSWTVNLSVALNDRFLPPDHFSMIERRRAPPKADELTLAFKREPEEQIDDQPGGIAVATVSPSARVVLRKTDALAYADMADRVTVRDNQGALVAVVEIVSPGNKHSIGELRAFVQKAADLIAHGVHLLVVDLFPPTKRDPNGMAKAIWDEFAEEDLALPNGKPLTISACDAGSDRTMYIYYCGVGDALPEVPLFIRPGWYVPVPLESTYASTWRTFPAPLKRLLER
jgi:Protein of unknown function (DUF4058)